MAISLRTILILVQVIHSCSALSLGEFYPYRNGPGVAKLQRNDDESSGEITLTNSFPFFDKQFNSLYVSITFVNVLYFRVLHVAVVSYFSLMFLLVRRFESFIKSH